MGDVLAHVEGVAVVVVVREYPRCHVTDALRAAKRFEVLGGLPLLRKPTRVGFHVAPVEPCREEFWGDGVMGGLESSG